MDGSFYTIQRTTRFWDGKGNGKLNSAKFCMENFQVVIHKGKNKAVSHEL